MNDLIEASPTLMSLFARIHLRWLQISRDYIGGNLELPYDHAIDAIADVLCEEGFTVMLHEHYHRLTEEK